VALVLGNEASGLDAAVLSAVSLRVGIPMAEGPESLNLAVAAGILSMAIVRRLAPRMGTPGAPSIGAMSEGPRR
jgi:tRNA G18 (ribose-2'-O)-methylase SpoU